MKTKTALLIILILSTIGCSATQRAAWIPFLSTVSTECYGPDGERLYVEGDAAANALVCFSMYDEELEEE